MPSKGGYPGGRGGAGGKRGEGKGGGKGAKGDGKGAKGDGKGGAKGGPAAGGKGSVVGGKGKGKGGNGKGRGKAGKGPPRSVREEFFNIKDGRIDLGDESQQEILTLIRKLMEVRGLATPSGERRKKKGAAAAASSSPAAAAAAAGGDSDREEREDDKDAMEAALAEEAAANGGEDANDADDFDVAPPGDQEGEEEEMEEVEMEEEGAGADYGDEGDEECGDAQADGDAEAEAAWPEPGEEEAEENEGQAEGEEEGEGQEEEVEEEEEEEAPPPHQVSHAFSAPGGAAADDDDEDAAATELPHAVSDKKWDVRVERRLLRQLLSEDRHEAKQTAEPPETEKKTKKGKEPKFKASAKAALSTKVRIFLCDEAKKGRKKGPMPVLKGGEEAVLELLEIARRSFGIKPKVQLWAYVSCEKGQAPAPLRGTWALGDDDIVVVSAREMPAAGAPSNDQAAASSAEVSRKSERSSPAPALLPAAGKEEAAAALDAVRAAYAERARAASSKGLAPLDRAEAQQLSTELAEHARSYASDEKLKGMRECRDALPAAKIRREFLAALERSQVVIVAGETGSGKTTQCPNFILEAASAAGRGGEVNIICTQPRRIAAVGVAERVAKERGEAPGQAVGYAVRLDVRCTRRTRLLFCTSGVLLQKLSSSPALDGVTHVIIDEAHERNLHTDFLLVILRELLIKRRDLRLVIMSATLEQALFVQYLAPVLRGQDVPVINISGRTYPVTVRYRKEAWSAARGRGSVERDAPDAEGNPEESANAELEAWIRKMHGTSPQDRILVSPEVRGGPDYPLIADLCAAILRGSQGPEGSGGRYDGGAILIFLPGHAEIERCLGDLRRHPGVGDLAWLLPLHGAMPVGHQQRVFKSPPEGKRKIVVSTNIAETSITIDDVTHVIDSGFVRETRYDPRSAMSVFSTAWVSQAAAKQRSGRAGRTRPGVCWRLYDEAFLEQRLPKYTLCEMRRTALEELVLQLRLLELGNDPGEFLQKAPEPPSREAVACAANTLVAIGALGAPPEMALTPLGFHLAHMPVDARTGKMLVYGALCRCLGPVLTIAACLSHKSPFTRTFNRDKELLQQRQRQERFGRLRSDHLAVAAAYNLYQATRRGESRDHQAVFQLCDALGMSSSALDGMAQLRSQFLRHLVEIGFARADDGEDGGAEVNANKDDHALVRCVLCAGLFPNVVQVQGYMSPQGLRHLLVGLDGERCYPHPSSLNSRQLQEFSCNHSWLLYHTKVHTSQVFVQDSTLIGATPLLLFGGELKVNKARTAIMVGGLLFATKEESAAVLLKLLRREIDRLLLLKISDPTADLAETSAPLLATITKLLQLEDKQNRGPTRKKG